MVPFEKIHACGNDFILLEQTPDPEKICAFCDRFHHLGADGVMVFEGVRKDVVIFRHFDPDGGASYCLNGTRAALTCLIEQGKIPSQGIARTEGVELEYIHSQGTQVFLEKAPVQPLTWEKGNVTGFFCDVGNPHFIVLDSMRWDTFAHLAPLIRRDKKTFAHGCNVSMVRQVEDGWRIRTFERGVEGMTKACGSGVLAASLALLETGCKGSLRFLPDGGEWIRVDDCGSKVALYGPTGWVASGVLR